MYVCRHVCINVCMYVCMYVSMYVLMYVCMYVCMYKLYIVHRISAVKLPLKSIEQRSLVSDGLAAASGGRAGSEQGLLRVAIRAARQLWQAGCRGASFYAALSQGEGILSGSAWGRPGREERWLPAHFDWCPGVSDGLSFGRAAHSGVFLEVSSAGAFGSIGQGRKGPSSRGGDRDPDHGCEWKR